MISILCMVWKSYIVKRRQFFVEYLTLDPCSLMIPALRKAE